YGEAGRQIYDFFWSEFADWYIESAKAQLAEGGARARVTAETLVRVLDNALRLLHPYMPFVTEEVWQHLRTAVLDSPLASLAADWPDALIVASWPEEREKEGWEDAKVADFTLLQDVIRTIRNLRAEKNIKPGQKLPAILASEKAALLREQSAMLARLAGLDSDALQIVEALPEKPEGHIALVAGPVEIYLPLAGLVDLAEERARLQKDLAEAESHINRLEKLLAGPFAEKAPAPVVQKERDKLAAYKETAEKIRQQLAELAG
ncbi:MAG: valine--tRNA ligase, partial [Anaerolineae bacterium]